MYLSTYRVASIALSEKWSILRAHLTYTICLSSIITTQTLILLRSKTGFAAEVTIFKADMKIFQSYTSQLTIY